MSGIRISVWCVIATTCMLGTACIPPESGAGADSTRSDSTMEVGRAAAYSANGSLTVTENGYGPLAIGMTVRDAAAAIGAAASAGSPPNPGCAYVNVANTPPGLRLMTVRDTVVSVRIDSGRVATGMGARVGDPEWRLRDLYGSRVTVQPSKYVTGGHTIVVSPIPPTDSGRRMVFETDGSKITSYRAGRVPEVQWVEGCS
ncbi:MAG: hypothetical protein M3Z30_04235 [Gemmatimonadota bacterium]|nr:hypothetical protein [Gemmatimonadota bacterium]